MEMRWWEILVDLQTNMITDEQVLDIVSKEIKTKTLGVTEQLLEIHSPIYIDGEIKIDRIDREMGGDYLVAYLPVLNERFYFGVSINISTKEVHGFYTEAGINVYFMASSEEFSKLNLKEMTNLIPTESWNKGDISPYNLKYNYKNSAILFKPNPEPDDLEDKLRKLLDFLEQDKNSILELVDKANGYIQIAMYIHNGNNCIGGISIGQDSIRRMSELNLSIDFDLYIRHYIE